MVAGSLTANSVLASMISHICSKWQREGAVGINRRKIGWNDRLVSPMAFLDWHSLIFLEEMSGKE